MTPTSMPRILPAARNHWRDLVARSGVIRGSWEFFRAVWEFVRDSTPSRLRSRFGDADYDWDFRVNTTSGAVGWRDRLLGVFHSPYQPTERELFHNMIGALSQHTKIDFGEFTFIDLGSGKGRTLLMASDYPFQRIVGVELLPSLNEIARQNLVQYRNESQKCFAIESICADATTFELPLTPLVIYLFNPFPEPGLRRTLSKLNQSLHTKPRAVYVLYHNPQLEPVLNEVGLMRIAGTHQYSIFDAQGNGSERDADPA
jgi:SAM-dependent methyltransferase